MSLMSSKAGVLWPLTSSDQGHMDCSSNEPALIKASIGQILCTKPGERIGRPTFGCDLRGVIFAPGDKVSEDLAAARVRDALLTWEPRIVVVAVNCAVTEEGASGLNGGNSLQVVVDYRHRSTGRLDRVEQAVR